MQQTDNLTSAPNIDRSHVQTTYHCMICGFETNQPGPGELGMARGNTERFCNTDFHLWKCPQCLSIHNTDPVDFQDIYRDYPLNQRTLDVFARGTLRNLMNRITRHGVKPTDSILDFGAGTGILLQFLEERGYHNISGYDPYVERYASSPHGKLFDCVIANDVIEHVADPRQMLRECAALVKPGGLLYVGTADSEPVDMTRLESQLMRLHQPFHRIIITEDSLKRLGAETGMVLIDSYRRSYMDTLMPFSNYRFLDEFNAALGHVMDRAFAPDAGKIVGRKPWLLFYALFGYLLPSAYEPAIILRKPSQ